MVEPAVLTACREVLGGTAANKIATIPLSSDMVMSHIESLSCDIETQLIPPLKKSVICNSDG